MLQPIESPPASLAPRLAASMIPGPPPVITAKPRSAMPAPDLARGGVVRRVGLDARGAEHRHGQADPRQHVEAVDELAHDAQHAPGVGVDEARVLLPLEQALVGRAHALLGRPLGRDATDAALLGPAFVRPAFLGHLVSSTRIVSARAPASTLPPESTTPMRSRGHGTGGDRRDRQGRGRLDQELRGAPHERQRPARGIVVDERDAGAELAQHGERALADLHRARAVGDRHRRVVEAHAPALGERALRVGRGRRLGAVGARPGEPRAGRPAPRPRAARRRRPA